MFLSEVCEPQETVEEGVDVENDTKRKQFLFLKKCENSEKKMKKKSKV